MKLKFPELFSCPLPSECCKTFDLQAQNMLQHRDHLGRRIYMIRVGNYAVKPANFTNNLKCPFPDNFDSSKATIEDIFRTNVLALEQIVREPETQIAGIVVILDMAGLSLQHAKFFTPYYAKRMVELVQETFPLRFKGFHVVNEPFYFDAVMAVLKPFLKEKIKKRARIPVFIAVGKALKLEIFQIYLHGSDIEGLHAFVPSELLPSEYGGETGPFDNRGWYMRLLANEEYFKNLETFGYKQDSAS